MQDGGEVDALGFPVFGDVAHVEHVDPPDHLVDGAEAQLRHDLAQFFGHEQHEVDDVLWLAGKLLSQHLEGFAIAGAENDGVRRVIFGINADVPSEYGVSR